ncbi:YigZ family protein [Rhodococcus sp. PAMC28707]|nr:YigZ family protein [Rhodococcus sp. PAMC28705]QCB60125.1 YigZ family protein [Rhodococcus sp. PAMC28707]
MFFTVERRVEALIEVKRSKFLAVVERAASEEAARAVIATARSANPVARHHCSAFVIGDVPGNLILRTNDDGEPSGTAGGPMLDVLVGREMTNVVAVVTRWFGGVKLGTGGLARAYGDAVTHALENARLLRRERRELLQVQLDYTEVGRVESELRARGIGIVSIDYRSRAVMTVQVEDVDAVIGLLAGLTGGTARPGVVGHTYVESALL